MPSNAYKRFNENAGDFDTLVDLYNGMVTLFESENDPVPQGMDVLFRAAVVLMVSQWEAYVEDICSEGLHHLVQHVRDPTSLPKEIRKQVAVELRTSKDETEMWKLADDGWRTYLQGRLTAMKEARDRSFNTPKSHNTADFFRRTLGIEDICKSWTFDKLAPSEVCKKLDALIGVRGQIAHRGRISEKIDKDWIVDHMAFLRKVVSKTGGAVNTHVKKASGKLLWT
jgi:hypothetical protein